MIEKLKNLFFIVVPYLLFCSAIYQITFWSDFNLNGLEIVSIEDVIKTSIFPFTRTFYESFFFIFLVMLVVIKKKKNRIKEDYVETELENDNIEQSNHKETMEHYTKLETLKKKRDNSFTDGMYYHFFKVLITFFKIFKLEFFVILILLILIPTILDYEFKAKWYSLFFIITIPITWLITSIIYSKEYKIDQSKFGVVFLIIAFPVFSFISGKSEANKILKGYNYNYIIHPFKYSDQKKVKYDTLKFVGFNDELMVFIGKNNEEKYFLETSSIGPLRHFKKKSPNGIMQ